MWYWGYHSHSSSPSTRTPIIVLHRCFTLPSLRLIVTGTTSTLPFMITMTAAITTTTIITPVKQLWGSDGRFKSRFLGGRGNIDHGSGRYGFPEPFSLSEWYVFLKAFEEFSSMRVISLGYLGLMKGSVMPPTVVLLDQDTMNRQFMLAVTHWHRYEAASSVGYADRNPGFTGGCGVQIMCSEAKLLLG
ncbi:hypothetical protein R1sor_016504 [Riccia sorocarpa]|uniref:Uncharacterized protein n=1 Tax=Riccia sorocarpa TaxID=122646 RepID=A0ABD3HF55_9MARC